jgi:hypothetical protein
MRSLELAIAAAIARDNLPERQCTKCGEWKGPGVFSAHAASRYGLRPQCRECDAAYHAANRERIAVRAAEYRRNNADKERERQTRRYAEKRDVIREQQAMYFAEYYAANRERRAANQAAWRAANQAAWRAANPDKARANNHRRRARKLRAYHAPFDEQAAIMSYGGLCRFCETAPATTLEHFVPLSWGGDHAAWNCFGSCGPCNFSRCNKDPYAWMETRGIDVDAWERKHIAGTFDLPRKLFKIARYRPPVEA